MNPDLRPSSELLAAYGLNGARLTQLTTGNINMTFFADVAEVAEVGGDRGGVENEAGSGPGRFVLQRLNPIFAPEIHIDIQAITQRLRQVGVGTPTLVRNLAGELWTTDADSGVWRLLTYINGIVHARADSPDLCAEAGHLAARFHRALVGLDHELRGSRSGVHDTARHLAHLDEVLGTHRAHPAFDNVARVAEQILDVGRRLEPVGELPPRLIHGDMKLDNFVFSETGEALALIDLDTLGVMSFPLELGDALRSWCNTSDEDSAESGFGLEHFRCALGGYSAAEPALLTPEEIAALPRAIETIMVELAARFAADALEESYFCWNRERYATAWAHNLERARGQLSLAKDFAAKRSAAEQIVRGVFGSLSG